VRGSPNLDRARLIPHKEIRTQRQRAVRQREIASCNYRAASVHLFDVIARQYWVVLMPDQELLYLFTSLREL